MSFRKVKRVLVTGGAGFIGSFFVERLQKEEGIERIVNLDLLVQGSSLENLSFLEDDGRYRFIHGNVCDSLLLEKIFEEERIDTVVHFAAETHVDRSISSSRSFFETNVMGTLSLCSTLVKFPKVHLHHISTDEVFGSLGNEGLFQESSLYHPNSPYSSSKASSDHIVTSFSHTYGLSYTLSYACNNYGPRQHVEKMIPRMLSFIFTKERLPIYGKGEQRRTWLFVEDHIEAIWQILTKARSKEHYLIGGGHECSNLELVHFLIDCLAKMERVDSEEVKERIAFVPDRLGHDFRYAIDSSKIEKELGWKARTSFFDGICKTIDWYCTIREKSIGIILRKIPSFR